MVEVWSAAAFASIFAAGAIAVTMIVNTANTVMIAFFIFLHPFKSCRLKNDGKLLRLFSYLKVVTVL